MGVKSPFLEQLSLYDMGVCMGALCPKCGGGTLQRSKRRLLEYPLSLFHVWPFRCKHCNARLLKYSRFSFK
jgi:hypothetical protein